MTTPRISCIIPAYNEAARIEGVLKAVVKVKEITEIVVVDDSSEDDISSITQKFPTIQLLTHSENRGKTAAIATGLLHSSGDYLVLLDADLLELAAEDIVQLLRPVLEGRADISISLRFKPWRLFGIDPISGERMVPRSLLMEYIDVLPTLSPFALETYMNAKIIEQNLRIAVVSWPNVESPLKYRKYGFSRGLEGDVGMVTDILHTTSVTKLFKQFYAMRLLRVR